MCVRVYVYSTYGLDVAGVTGGRAPMHCLVGLGRAMRRKVDVYIGSRGQWIQCLCRSRRAASWRELWHRGCRWVCVCAVRSRSELPAGCTVHGCVQTVLLSSSTDFIPFGG